MWLTPRPWGVSGAMTGRHGLDAVGYRRATGSTIAVYDVYNGALSYYSRWCIQTVACNPATRRRSAV